MVSGRIGQDLVDDGFGELTGYGRIKIGVPSGTMA